VQRVRGAQVRPLLMARAEASGVAAIPSAIGGTSEMPRVHSDRQGLTQVLGITLPPTLLARADMRLQLLGG
jgi:hypothetical protein